MQLRQSVVRPLTESTNFQSDGNQLRVRADADGYLLIRDLLPSALIEEVAAELALTMAEAGWILADEPLSKALADVSKFCVEPQPPFMEVFYKQLSLRSLHALKHHENLLALFQTLFDEPVLSPPHFVTRLAFPFKDDFATPAHQDYTHFEGSRRNWAAWIPFTDVDRDRGGLAVAAGTHKGGVLDMRPALGAGQMVIDADLNALDWRWSPMRVGDVLIHNCQTIHKGLPNQSGRMRVSMDCRYQPLSEPIGEKYLGVSHQMRSWDELYADWAEDDPLKFYWRDLDLKVEPFTYHWYDKRDERAIQMGGAGDPEALVALENISLKHRDPEVRARAAVALNSLTSSTR
jgi:ectoine hydroxylase-related dioxygenase (phytanoyl-CoA dioxygenase family)